MHWGSGSGSGRGGEREHSTAMRLLGPKQQCSTVGKIACCLVLQNVHARQVASGACHAAAWAQYGTGRHPSRLIGARPANVIDFTQIPLRPASALSHNTHAAAVISCCNTYSMPPEDRLSAQPGQHEIFCKEGRARAVNSLKTCQNAAFVPHLVHDVV